MKEKKRKVKVAKRKQGRKRKRGISENWRRRRFESLPGRKIWRRMRWIWRFGALKPGKTNSTSPEHFGPLDPDRRDTEHQNIEISEESEKEKERERRKNTQVLRPNARNFSANNRAVRAASQHVKCCVTGCPMRQVRTSVGLKILHFSRPMEWLSLITL